MLPVFSPLRPAHSAHLIWSTLFEDRSPCGRSEPIVENRDGVVALQRERQHFRLSTTQIGHETQSGRACRTFNDNPVEGCRVGSAHPHSSSFRELGIDGGRNDNPIGELAKKFELLELVKEWRSVADDFTQVACPRPVRPPYR